MTDIQHNRLMTVGQFFQEMQSGSLTDSHTGRKLFNVGKDGKLKEGSAKITIENKEEVEDFIAAPIYNIDVSLEGIPGTENIECRRFTIDCNKISASISATDIPKQNQKSETEAEFYDKEYKEDAKESKVKKK